jgi:hypothetical protein
MLYGMNYKIPIALNHASNNNVIPCFKNWGWCKNIKLLVLKEKDKTVTKGSFL